MKKQLFFIFFLILYTSILQADEPIKPLIDEARCKKIKEAGNKIHEFQAFCKIKQQELQQLTDGREVTDADREKIKDIGKAIETAQLGAYEAMSFLENEKSELYYNLVLYSAECMGPKHTNCKNYFGNQILTIKFLFEALANTKEAYSNGKDVELFSNPFEQSEQNPVTTTQENTAS
jgi:hypothetical protein